MKKVFLTLFAVCGILGVKAQNVQLHYDFGRTIYNSEGERPILTSTVEMFKPDKWGSTYFFIDMDYASEGVSSAYWEIGRELKFWKGPLSVHVEYNGGLKYINHAYLLGGTYTWNSADFSRNFSISAMYKYIQKNPSPHNFQLTGVWNINFCQDKYTFSGFIDWWREKNEQTGNEFVAVSEPQFWVNLNKFKHIDKDFNLSLGTEVEMSYNFAGRNGFYAIPTVAMKWTF